MERLGFCFLDRPSVEKQIELVKTIERLGYESAWVTETRLAQCPGGSSSAPESGMPGREALR